ncbi:hypothetical protein [Sandaracinus amylolyticus]|uniref:hypothetical protein n=1 Tax=Sandaracinus amylolyticus TaxID=927083 RepID=UPI001F3ADDA2|nr:hypothetical protein [Sandaracinus amylolyticus]UJR78774.1 Hypothetical protein I5071_8060 [Sandaracinus amylolyticus]
MVGERGAVDGVVWGEPVRGVRFGLRPPPGELEAGSSIALELVCENRGLTPIWVFGFQKGYPRSLRVSPPKPDRPYIRVSFADVNVLHAPDAFVRVMPNESVRTWLDLSFAFDRRGAGAWSIAFAYDAIRGAGGMRAWKAPDDTVAQTGVASIVVSRARSLREAGIDDALEAELDAMLLGGSASTVDRLRQLGRGGAAYAARRFARVLVPGADATLGWKALDALELLGADGLEAVQAAREDLPHAASALDFAAEWIAFRLGREPAPEHLPFVTMLEQLVHQPDRRGNLVVTWTPHDSPVHGSQRMEIFGNGDRIVVVRPAGQAVPSTRRTLMGAMPMQTLLEALVWSGVWLLRPVRAQGLPDEPRPALEVQLALGEPFTRKIAMWNGEWRHGPAFRLADLLDRLAAAVRPESLPPPR